MEQQHGTSATARRLSNLGHWVEGGLFAVIGVLGLIDAVGALSGALRYLAPAPLVLVGLVIPAILFGHSHGTAGHARELIRDPQQRQHLVMAGLMLISGLVEIIATMGVGLLVLRCVWPLGLGLIGFMFLRHTQHGSHTAQMKAVRFHRALGGAILLAAFARIFQVMTAGRGAGIAYSVLMIVVAVMLITYREPSGAYAEASPPGGDGGHGGHPD